MNKGAIIHFDWLVLPTSGTLLPDDPARVQDTNIIKDEPGTIIWRCRLPDSTQAIVKMYRRQTGFDWLRKRLSRFRVQREFETLRYLNDVGLDALRPVYWDCGFHRNDGFYELLVTEEIKQAMSFQDYIEEVQDPGPDLNLIDRLGERIYCMHRAGFYHGALLTRNVLVVRDGDQELRCVLADTPKSIRYRKSIVDTAMARRDVLDFIDDLSRFASADILNRFLLAYGLDRSQADLCLRRLRTYCPTKLFRNRTQAGFLVRRTFRR